MTPNGKTNVQEAPINRMSVQSLFVLEGKKRLFLVYPIPASAVRKESHRLAVTPKHAAIIWRGSRAVALGMYAKSDPLPKH